MDVPAFSLFFLEEDLLDASELFGFSVFSVVSDFAASEPDQYVTDFNHCR